MTKWSAGGHTSYVNLLALTPRLVSCSAHRLVGGWARRRLCRHRRLHPRRRRERGRGGRGGTAGVDHQIHVVCRSSRRRGRPHGEWLGPHEQRSRRLLRRLQPGHQRHHARGHKLHGRAPDRPDCRAPPERQRRHLVRPLPHVLWRHLGLSPDDGDVDLGRDQFTPELRSRRGDAPGRPIGDPRWRRRQRL